jgi:FkbM family methyltransferase
LHWRRQLDSILSESTAEARQRESTKFDEAAGQTTSIVIVGAGNLGRNVLRGLNSAGREVTAIADSNPRLWNSSIEGIRVMSPADAAEGFGGSSVFVICIWHPDRYEGVQHHIERMVALGARRTVPFVWLFWKYPELFLPYYLWDLPSKIPEQADDIRAACEVLADDCARSQFVSQVEFRSRADFGRQPVPSHTPAYFANDLFSLLPDERFVDCGAFDGDSIQSFLEASDGKFARIDAFESDPLNFASLQRVVESNGLLKSTTVLHQKAVSSTVGSGRFSATGQANAGISDQGDIEMSCTTLDESLDGQHPTFIKMDIEGAEIDALRGARRIITRHQPLLAICVYHRQNDLWRIPMLMHELEPESLLTLRPYWLDGFDLVCYAVPPNRVKRQAGLLS